MPRFSPRAFAKTNGLPHYKGTICATCLTDLRDTETTKCLKCHKHDKVKERMRATTRRLSGRTPEPLPSKNNSKRAKASRQGKTWYEGVPCKHCGQRQRLVTTTQCLKCLEDGNTAYSRNREALKKKASDYQFNRWKNHREILLFQNAKSRAKQNGRDFDIDQRDIVIHEFCPVFGTPMLRPSLDRIDNGKGYVKGNVEVISRRANSIKNDATIEELEQIIAYMKRNRQSPLANPSPDK